MGKDYDGLKTDLYFDVEKNKLPYRLYESAIPLYTHPTKTLTNREIDNLIADVVEKPTDEDLYDFAKAILKKAQE
jgi:hypothetical protein